MQILVNTDNHTEGGSKLTQFVEELVESKLRRFASRITRVEVHVSDQNSEAKSGADDIRCVMEVRLNGLQPISVSDNGENQDQVLRGAAGKMERLIESTLGKLDHR